MNSIQRYHGHFEIGILQALSHAPAKHALVLVDFDAETQNEWAKENQLEKNL